MHGKSLGKAKGSGILTLWGKCLFAAPFTKGAFRLSFSYHLFTKGIFIMKKVFSLTLALLMLLCCFTACGNTNSSDPWASATYKENKEFGEGEKTIELEVIVNDHKVTFTIHTDATLLSDALLEHKLLEGDPGDYGLYVKKVNGIQADYDKDQAYWGLSIGGEYAMTGVDGTEIVDGGHYEFTYTKG